MKDQALETFLEKTDIFMFGELHTQTHFEPGSPLEPLRSPTSDLTLTPTPTHI